MMQTNYTAVRFCQSCYKIHKVLIKIFYRSSRLHCIKVYFYGICKSIAQNVFLSLENRQLLGAVNGIDVLLQCLSVCLVYQCQLGLRRIQTSSILSC